MQTSPIAVFRATKSYRIYETKQGVEDRGYM